MTWPYFCCIPCIHFYTIWHPFQSNPRHRINIEFKRKWHLQGFGFAGHDFICNLFILDISIGYLPRHTLKSWSAYITYIKAQYPRLEHLMLPLILLLTGLFLSTAVFSLELNAVKRNHEENTSNIKDSMYGNLAEIDFSQMDCKK